MNEQLLQRGKQLFTDKINAYLAETDIDGWRIDLLNNLKTDYQDKVTPIALDGTFAANRFALACIEAAETVADSIDKGTAIETMAQKIYEGLPIGGKIESRKNEPISEDTKQLNRELNKLSDSLSKKPLIDLVWDVPIEELDVEGARVRGYLPADFDGQECDHTDFVIEESEGNLVANVFYDETGSIVLTCPMCNSNELFLETVTGCCMLCDCEFDVPLNLSDSMDENATAEYRYEDLGDRGGITRSTGEKKNRGIIIIGEDYSESEESQD